MNIEEIENIELFYENKKFNLKIYKTDKLENYIKNILKFKVNGE